MTKNKPRPINQRYADHKERRIAELKARQRKHPLHRSRKRSSDK